MPAVMSAKKRKLADSLAELALSLNVNDRISAAVNPSTPESSLMLLAYDTEPRVVFALAERQNLSKDVVAKLYDRCRSAQVRRRILLIQNNFHAGLLKYILSRNELEDMVLIAKKKNLPETVCDYIIDEGRSLKTLACLASNDSISLKTVQKLAYNEGIKTLTVLVSNPACPVSVVKEIAEKNTTAWNVRYRVQFIEAVTKRLMSEPEFSGMPEEWVKALYFEEVVS